MIINSSDERLIQIHCIMKTAPGSLVLWVSPQDPPFWSTCIRAKWYTYSYGIQASVHTNKHAQSRFYILTKNSMNATTANGSINLYKIVE